MEMKAIFTPVKNRVPPSEAFIKELTAWCKSEDPEVFAPNKLKDIYSLAHEDLGPYDTMLYRRAAMCEVLRVLAAFESSYNWKEGHDKSNPKENNVLTMSAGAFQISPDSMNLHSSLADYAMKFEVYRKPAAFRALMMSNHAFAMGYAARLLRVNTRHNGPVRDGHIFPELRREAVREFMNLIR